MSAAKWEWWTSCSYRRLMTSEGKPILTPTVLRDGHPDIAIDGGPEGRVAKLVEAAPQLLAACELACQETCRFNRPEGWQPTLEKCWGCYLYDAITAAKGEEG